MHDMCGVTIDIYFDLQADEEAADIVLQKMRASARC